MTIVGSLHLYETRRVGMIGPKTEKDADRARFDFAGASELEVIEMLESVLSTIKARYEAQQDKPIHPEEALTPRERARNRRTARSVVTGDPIEDEDEEPDDDEG